jgi:lipopolysaccharide transport system ATP-binding protein
LGQIPAISLRGVSKKYQLYDSLRHRLYEALHPFKKKLHREFWALRDVSMEIPRGATVGILGVNGSGKSTLLQIICSILQPTSGEVAVHGRVAALIELGAGFNPDLSGRENAEINCAIMGLDGRTVRERLPGIETFADIGEFFEQPVKTYSSGMFMRVAFATAISVDPDILIIDEALAVGDAKFQEKCFRKFREFQSAGKTILLVTHDRSAVPRLCTHGVLLHKGRVLLSGSPKDVTDHYSHLLTHGAPPKQVVGTTGIDVATDTGPPSLPMATASAVAIAVEGFLARSDLFDRCPQNPTYNKNEFSYGLGGASIVDYLISESGAVNQPDVQSGGTIELYIRVRYDRVVEKPIVGFTLKTRDGTLAYGTNTGWLQQELSPGEPGQLTTYKFTVRMDLGADDWFIELAVAASQAEVLHTREAVIHLRTTSSIVSTGFSALQTSFSEIK